MGFGGYSYNGGHDAGKRRGEELERKHGKHKGKTVFATDQAIHVWAQQSQPYGRNAKASVYFSGDTIYSYGAHFPMARIIGGAVLINSEKASVTTSGHQSSVRAATRHLQRFDVPYVVRECYSDEDMHKRNVAALARDVENHLKDARNPRRSGWKRGMSLAEARDTHADALAYVSTFGVDASVPALPEDLAALELEVNRARDAQQAKRQAADQLKREWEAKRAEEKLAEALPVFRETGERMPLNWHALPCFLAVRGDSIVTSWGAEFPTEHGAKAWPILKALRERGEAWHANGHTIKLGHFQIDRVTADGTVYAGCHVVPFEEVARIAEALGL
jgi:hypothetical protein